MTPQELLVEELNCRIEMIEAQRTDALTAHAVAGARLKMANARITQLEAQVAELTKRKEYPWLA